MANNLYAGLNTEAKSNIADTLNAKFQLLGTSWIWNFLRQICRFNNKR
jgi:hypothetical protein